MSAPEAKADESAAVPVQRGSAARIRELEEQVANLEAALEHSRTIGIAIGVLMTGYKISSEAAIDLLKRVSQNTNRKVYELAEAVALSGELPTA